MAKNNQAIWQGLLGAGNAMTQASRPRLNVPGPGIGGVLGAAGPGFQQGFQGYQDRERKMAQNDFQMKVLKQRYDAGTAATERAEEQRRQQGILANKMQYGTGANMMSLNREPAPGLDFNDPSTMGQLFRSGYGNQAIDAAAKLGVAQNRPGKSSEFERLAAIPEAQRSPEQNARLSFMTTTRQPLVQFMGGDPFQAEQAKNFFGRGKGIMDSALRSGGVSADMRVMEDLISNGLETGFGAGFQNTVRKAGKFLGMNTDMGQVTAAEVMNSFANANIAPLVKQLGVNPTDKDLEFIVKSFPTMDKTSAGNLIVIRAIRRKADRDRALSDLHSKATAMGKPGPAWFNKEAVKLMHNTPLLSKEDRATLMGLVRNGKMRNKKKSDIEEEFGLTPLPD